MTAFRLQTFAPAADPARARAAELDRRLGAAREDAYRDGFLAGQSAAVENFLGDQARLTSDLIEALNDASLGNEAARRHVAASVAPMVRALCEAITPALAETGLFAEISRLVTVALDAAPEARPRLRCAPELAPTLTSILAERGIAATVEAAPELLPREAQVFWDQGYDHLDLDACVAQIGDCLASHLGAAGKATPAVKPAVNPEDTPDHG
ncbi:hypothetical protein [uncultured Amaricoccus sp.]|uniref:hypothetical protein n=1 Tax=uncultured Amaricoccus sp. TaxID=339341 RepID=UPI002602DC6B|nr:hypothetical protein [uncultured Amaricoccus sp.]